MNPVDLILTASNRAQARGYLAELRQRERAGVLDQCARYLVAPDSGGRRVGSGTATLFAIRSLVERVRRERRDRTLSAEAALADRRVLIIHSGGDSRRLIAFAAHGKIFTPLPLVDRPSQASSLFDLILDDLASIDWPDDGGVLIASGDVLLGVAKHRLRFKRDRITTVAWPSSIERASRHGVFVVDSDGRVTDVLQKPDEATLRSRGAIDAHGHALLDLGLLFVPAREATRWLNEAQSAEMLCGDPPATDLYAQMLPALAKSDAASSSDARAATFLRSLGGRSLHAITVPDSLFFHIGSTRELLDNITSGAPRDVIPRNRHHRAAIPGSLPHNAIVIHSVVERASTIEGAAFVDASYITQGLHLKGRNVVVGAPRESDTPIDLPQEAGIVCLPLGEDDWTAIAFGVDDDFKTPASAASHGGTFCGRPLSALDRHCWSAGDDHTLWSARLWAIGTASHVVQHALAMIDDPVGCDTQRLFSAATIMARVNHRRLLAHRDAVQMEARRRTLRNRLHDGRRVDVHEAAHDLESLSAAEIGLARIGGSMSLARQPVIRARSLRLAAAIEARFPAARPAWAEAPPDFAQAAFTAIAQGVQSDVKKRAEPRAAVIVRGQLVRVTAPVRIDLAGGWSDTPPICNEVGGSVVNVAMRLDGAQPISATARLIDEPLVRIRSVDLNRSIDLTHAVELCSHHDPADWAALPKAALVLSGIVPPVVSGDLKQWLKTLGGGVELTISSDLPKGSGLGASSILGAATLACLSRLVGETLSRENLIARTSALEQMMSTAGGWQDQAGGITGGAKLLTTEPGAMQIPHEQPLAIPADFWRERVLLYSTGLQRLARDILQNVVWRWLGGGADVERIVRRLREGALRMRDDLHAGDMDRFARGVLEYWELKKAIDPGATTPVIDALIARVRPHLTAWELPGAGGGGFLFMIARDADEAANIRRILSADPPNTQARFFAPAIDECGLRVSTSD